MKISTENVSNVSTIEEYSGELYSTIQPEPCLAEIIRNRGLSDVSSELIVQCRIKYGSRWHACKGLLLEYMKGTTLHGVRYIFSIHRPLYEKFYWVLFTLISCYIAISLTWDTFFKWRTSPVTLTFDETLVPVHKIPFPTVTICPEIKMEQKNFDFKNMSERFLSEVEKYQEFRNYENFTQEQLDYFASTLQICEEEVVNRLAAYTPRVTDSNIAQILVDLSVSKNETAPFCKWDGRFYFCNDILNYVLTDEGVCYQFNGLHAADVYRDLSYLNYYDKQVVNFQNTFDEGVLPMNNITGSWSLEDGFVGQGYSSYPQRTVSSSARNAFFAFLQGYEHNFEYACRNFKQGYRIFLHSPESVPLTSSNYILLSHGDEVMVTVSPQYVIGDNDLREFSPETRQCYFNDERYLRYFNYYSQANCQTECLTNYTIGKCGCANFWMPNFISLPYILTMCLKLINFFAFLIIEPQNISVCEASDIPCSTKAQKELTLLLQKQTMKQTVDASVKIMCSCMPSCTSLDYHVEISSARYDLAKTLAAFREQYEHSDFLASRLSVFFKERQFAAIKRTVLFNMTSFLANCGGIFGLFIGFSSITVFELIYFLTLRLISNLRMRRKALKKFKKFNFWNEN